MDNDKLASLKILIVEDELIARKVLDRTLISFGCETQCVDNGRDALTFVNSFHYPIIFVDIGLPDISGMEVAKKIRRYEKILNRKSAKIFAVTAYAEDEVRDEALSSGIDAVFTKPLIGQALYQVVVDHS